MAPTSCRQEKPEEEGWKGEQRTPWSLPQLAAQSGIFLTTAAVAAQGTLASYSLDALFTTSVGTSAVASEGWPGEGWVCDNLTPVSVSVLCILSPWLCYS